MSLFSNPFTTVERQTTKNFIKNLNFSTNMSLYSLIKQKAARIATALFLPVMLTGCGGALQTPYQKKEKENIVTEDPSKLAEEVQRQWDNLKQKEVAVSKTELEKEVSKWDPWVFDFVNGINFVKEQIKTENVFGEYRPFSNELTLPYLSIDRLDDPSIMLHLPVSCPMFNCAGQKLDDIDWKKAPFEDLKRVKAKLDKVSNRAERKKKLFIDSLDHELTHALIDDSQEGLRTSPYFSGPTRKEVQRHILKMYQSPELQGKIINIFAFYFSRHAMRVAKTYGGLEGFIAHDFSIAPEKYQQCDQLLDKHVEEITENDVIYRTFDHNLVDMIDILSKRAEEGEGKLFFEELKGDDLRTLMEKLTFFQDTDENGGKEYYFKGAPHISLKTSIYNGHCYRYTLELSKLKKFFLKIGIPEEEIHGYYQHWSDRLHQEQLITEVHARIIDSVMSVYVNEKTDVFPPALWRQRPEELAYLSTWRYKGNPVFQKSLEKYNLALEMQKDGVSPENIRKQLEYAVSFTYKGESYNWPANKCKKENCFVIKK